MLCLLCRRRRLPGSRSVGAHACRAGGPTGRTTAGLVSSRRHSHHRPHRIRGQSPHSQRDAAERASSPDQAIPYNEEALRRDFQALWNTQYFEDIRLEVEDSPDQSQRENRDLPRGRAAHHPPHRIQRQQIRISESDILDRFKDPKWVCRSKASSIPRKSKKRKWYSRSWRRSTGISSPW